MPRHRGPNCEIWDEGISLSTTFSPELAPGQRRTQAMALLWGIVTAATIHVGAITVAAFGSTIERDLHITHTLLGTIQTGFYFGNALGSLGFAWLIRRAGLKTAAVLALGAAMAGNLLCSVPQVLPLFLGRACLGVAISGMALFASCVVVNAFPKRQHALLSLVHAAFVCGAGLGMFIAVPLVSLVGVWWHIPLLFAGILVLPLAALGTLGDLRSDESIAVENRQALLAACREPAMWRASAVLAGYILAETAFILFFPIYAQELGRDPAAAARTAGVFIGGIAAGRLFVALSGASTSGVRTVIVLAVSGGAVLLLSVLPWPAPVSGVLLFVGGLLAGPTAPLAISIAVNRARQHRHEILALTNLLLCLSGLAAGILAGVWSDAISVRTALAVSAFLFSISFVPILALRAVPVERPPVADRHAPEQDVIP